jgi:hypothetical protein
MELYVIVWSLVALVTAWFVYTSSQGHEGGVPRHQIVRTYPHFNNA